MSAAGRPHAAGRFRRDDRGSAIIQFAATAPALLLIILAGFEFAVVLFVAGSLESSVLAASRFGITGFSETGVTREERIREIIENRTHGLVDMDATEIITKVYPSFSDIGRPEPFTDADGDGVHDPGESFNDINGNGRWDDDMGRTGLGGPGDIVLYDIRYEAGAITSLLEPIIGRIVHRAAVAVRNEPY